MNIEDAILDSAKKFDALVYLMHDASSLNKSASAEMAVYKAVLFHKLEKTGTYSLLKDKLEELLK